jgi:regulatory protein
MIRPEKSADEHDEDARVTNPVEARKKAMDYLARREYGYSELLARLVAAGFDDSVAAGAVDRLAVEGLQNDQRFVDAFLRSRINQGKGPVRIRLELRRHGIDEFVVDARLSEAGEDWTALAARVRAKKFGDDLPREFREKARQMRFLQYRGFESDQVRRAVGGEDE